MATVEQRLEDLEKSQKRYRLTLLVVVMLMQVMVSNVEAERVSGDFDGNGVVDFSDFLVFAGNFGKTGDTFDPNSPNSVVVYDTVKVYVQELITTTTPEDGVISGLTHIEVLAYKLNWDADIEDDGIRVAIYMHGIGNFAVGHPVGEIIVDVVVSVYDTNDNLVVQETHRGSLSSLFKISNDNFNVAREKLEPFGRAFKVKATLITPKQGTFEAIDNFALTDGAGNNQK